MDSIQKNPLVEAFLQMAGAAKEIATTYDEEPYVFSTETAGGIVIAAGRTNVPLIQTDFLNALEWPFKLYRIRFTNDPQHTYRDWRVRCVDQTYNQEWMKNPVMVESLVQVNTGFWELPKPWIVRSQGGGQQWFVDNLDTVNPITVNIALHGALVIPHRD
jgi:hypothetical protein